ncbi:MAG: hypothetical protein Q8P15_00850 [Nanoarchaeota archaeon]|nr:hypothetical protein [Nanoarchaeota archaeon]
MIGAYSELVKMTESNLDVFGKVVRINGNKEIEKVSEDIYREFLDIYNKR